MRILIVIPTQPRATGNWITAERFSRGLSQRGHQTRILSVSLENSLKIEAEIHLFRPETAILLHAYRTGSPWFSAPVAGRTPCAVLLTGTDVNEDLLHPGKSPRINHVLARAGAVLSQNPALFEHPLVKAVGDRLHLIPPGIELGKEPLSLRKTFSLPDNRPVLLHPAGIRPVKGNLELLQMLSPLAAHVSFTLAFCGPILDDAYGEQLLKDIDQNPWARYLGAIAPSAMPAAMAESDLILNNSRSEGLPNALLEASALGRPILAANIPGNASVVEPGINGLLFDDVEDLRSKALRLIRDPGLRSRLSLARPELYSTENESFRLEQALRCAIEAHQA